MQEVGPVPGLRVRIPDPQKPRPKRKPCGTPLALLGTMLLWSISILSATLGIILAASEASRLTGPAFNIGGERRALQKITMLFHELQETLEAGLVPTQEQWKQVTVLKAPWGELAHKSLQELRSAGGSLLPTLRRLRGLSEEHLQAIGEARAKSSQALAQAAGCLLLVPIFGSALYVLLPGLEERITSWIIGCVLSGLLAGAGAAWVLSMSEQARWGGLAPSRRSWILTAQCAGERFLALIRSGVPADLAWTQTHQLLQSQAPGLAADWGASLWSPAGHRQNTTRLTGMRGALAIAGISLRKAVQVSLMEGRPCGERVETALLALGQDIRTEVDRELNLLATRALKPLFLCVAPALIGMLVFGMYLGWLDVVADGF